MCRARAVPSSVTVPVGSWQGPVASGFGVHLVYISERVDGSVPPLDEVREAVEREWLAAKRKESNEALYENWRALYSVTIEGLSADEEGNSK